MRSRCSLFACLFSLIGFATLPGCGEKPATPPKAAAPATPSVEKPSTQSAPPSQEAASGTKASAANPTPTKGPDAAVVAVLDGMRANRPEALWDFLPASLQANLNEAVREVGRSADAEVWNRAAELLKKIVTIFETKKEFILASPFWKTAEKVDPKQVAANWEHIVGLLGSIVNSEISDVERLKSFDGRKFLADSGGKFLTHLQALSSTLKSNPITDLKDVKVTLKSQEGERAVITIEAPGEPAVDHEFTIIEGKWCPKSWIESTPRLAELKDGIKQVLQSERVAKQKESILQELDQIETGIDELLTTKTAQEFNDLVAQRVIPYLLVRSAPFRSPGETGAPSSPSVESGSVTVVVTPKLDDKKADELVETLAGLSDNAGQSVVFGPNARDEGLEFTVTPVGDPEAFSKKITFGSVVSVDKAKRTVTVTIEARNTKAEP